jgi:hypothetical protein
MDPQSPPKKPLIPRDKVLHFLFSAAIAFGAYILLDNVFMGGVVAIIVGAVKEMVDIGIRKAHGGGEAMMDLVADILGVVLFWIVAAAMIPKEAVTG